MFISYDIRSGVEYAKLCISKRNGKVVSKSYIYLGKVIDKEKFIFFNKDRGLFNYNPVDNSYTSLNSQSSIYSQDIPLNNNGIVDKKVENIELKDIPDFQNEQKKDIVIDDITSDNFSQNQQNIQEKPIETTKTINTTDENLKADKYEQDYFYGKKDVLDQKNNNEIDYFSNQNQHYADNEIRKELNIEYILKNTLSYGDVNFIQKIIDENQIGDVIDIAEVANKSLFYVLIFHSILGNNTTNLKYWYDHSFIKYLYPGVDCQEQNIYEDLEFQQEKFFSLYQNHIVKRLDVSTIDITNVYDDTRLLLNHQGIPICCLDAKSNLQDIIEYLKNADLNTTQYIVNVDDLCNCDPGINLIANVDERHELYDIILDSYSANNLEFVKYGDVYYQICKKQIQYEQYNLYTYTFCDILKQSQRNIQILSNCFEENCSFSMTFDNVVISNADIDSKKILEIIKTNDSMANYSFKNKNNVVNFISSIIISTASKCLKMNFSDAMMVLRNVKCFIDEKNNKNVIEKFDYSEVYSY